ncbi:transglutaminase domain-containing protein [Paenibacillus yanchengensis]|uniref:Transglutaminase domain-containing protein n=1 Tax=Paenibacillus yanchengensis TaxID=2035833 RepID=A0ABW4YIT9_9BACL
MKRALWRLMWIVVIVYGIYYLNEQVKDESELSKQTLSDELSTLSTAEPIPPEVQMDSESSLEDDEQQVPSLLVPEDVESNDSLYEQINPEVAEPYVALEKEIRRAFLDREESFTVTFDGDSKKLKDDLGIIIEQAMTWDDYTAYIIESYRYTVQSFAKNNTITIESKYRESIEQSAFVSKQADDILAKIIKPEMNDHEKVLAIHDWIVTNITYDSSLTRYTAYDALTVGTTVCQGYSLITHRLMNGAGIESIITEGEVESGLHSWNMVKLDGHWYHIDTTWDDPVGGTGISYKYYLVTDEQLQKDHSWTNPYPVATVSYNQQLQQLTQQLNKADSNQEQGNLYENIRQHVGLHWFDDEHTVSSVSAIEQRMKAALKSKKELVQFRYNGDQELKQLLQAAAKKMNTSFSYSATFEPMIDGQSQFVNIQLKY